MSDKIKYVVIAHGGSGGICAAAIAISKLEDPIDLYFSQSYTIQGLVKKLLRTEQHDKIRIYILNIHINAATIELLKKFDRVVYIDHHRHSVKHKDIFPGKIDQYKSSSQLASEYFSALKSASELATIGTISDRMLSVSPNDPMFQESLLLQKSIIHFYDDEEFRKYLVEQMSGGLLPSQINGVKERAKNSENTLKRLIKQANSNIVDTKTCAITTINENGKGFGRQIANYFSADRDYPVFLLYPDIPRNKIVILARNNFRQKNTIDLSKFMSAYFNGGGHATAAGGVIEGLDNPGIDMVKKCFEEYLR